MTDGDDLAAELMGVLIQAVRHYRDAGLETREIIELIDARLSAPLSEDKARRELGALLTDALNRVDHDFLRSAGDSGSGGRPERFRPNMSAPPGTVHPGSGREQDDSSASIGRWQPMPNAPDAAPFLPPHGQQPDGWLPPRREFRQTVEATDPGVPANAMLVDADSGYPVGTAGTDTRGRVCTLEEDGWHRAGTEGVLTYEQVCQAVGQDIPGSPWGPKPGPLTIVVQPAQRSQVPMIVRPGEPIDVVMDEKILDGEGKEIIGPNGQPMMRHVKDTIRIDEIVPDQSADG